MFSKTAQINIAWNVKVRGCRGNYDKRRVHCEFMFIFPSHISNLYICTSLVYTRVRAYNKQKNWIFTWSCKSGYIILFYLSVSSPVSFKIKVCTFLLIWHLWPRLSYRHYIAKYRHYYRQNIGVKKFVAKSNLILKLCKILSTIFF